MLLKSGWILSPLLQLQYVWKMPAGYCTIVHARLLEAYTSVDLVLGDAMLD